jgi:hypothetical protein
LIFGSNDLSISARHDVVHRTFVPEGQADYLTQRPPRSPHSQLGGFEAWSAYFDKRSADSDAETLASFAEYIGQHSKNRENIKSLFDALELDDYVSFGGKP